MTPEERQRIVEETLLGPNATNALRRLFNELMQENVDGPRAFLAHPQHVPTTRAGSGVTVTRDALGYVVSSSGGSGDSDQFILPNQIFGP